MSLQHSFTYFLPQLLDKHIGMTAGIKYGSSSETSTAIARLPAPEDNIAHNSQAAHTASATIKAAQH